MVKKLSKPKPRTLRAAERDLHSGKSSESSKRTGGYVVKNAKGVKEKRKRK